jgi:hypothetical protein
MHRSCGAFGRFRFEQPHAHLWTDADCNHVLGDLFAMPHAGITASRDNHLHLRPDSPATVWPCPAREGAQQVTEVAQANAT